MRVNLDRETADLARQTVVELRSAYAELFGEPPRSRHRQWLVRRMLWRRQALEEGDLSERARRRAAELVNDADLRLLPPRNFGTSKRKMRVRRIDSRLPSVGATMTRFYKGRIIEVRVLEEGFEYAGAVYKTLSAAARAVTGQHCNGYFFFRLGKEALS
jgi:hypothetical protein